MDSFQVTLHFFLLLFVHHLLLCMSNMHKTSTFLRSSLISLTPTKDNSPTLYFEVTKPFRLPNTQPCTYLALQHDFGFTYGRPPVLVNYTAPHCSTQDFTKIVLEWNATSKGIQFDRIFGVWLGGIELLRSCTAEPTPNGVVWTVEKDITRYSSLLLKKGTQNLIVYLGNIVDRTYTGEFHVNLTFHFYPADMHSLNDHLAYGYGYDSNADLILPISRDLPLNDGLWFEIQNSNDTKLKQFRIPQNVYRAVLEVYVSYHENDEFWYANYANDYNVSANNLTKMLKNGPFREVVVSIDDEVIGAVWPFTVIYTGGINPLFWSPISGIGSFNLPSYDIEITPFLGNLLDGNLHDLGFTVTNALNVWFIGANVHLWLDSRGVKTEGKLLKCTKNIAISSYDETDSEGLNIKFSTNASRLISSTGWIKSSYGNITTRSIQEFGFGNILERRRDEKFQIVKQIIHFNDRVHAYSKKPFPYVHVMESLKSFPLKLYMGISEQGEGTFTYVSNVTLAFNEKKYKKFGFDNFFISSLNNTQDAQATVVISKLLTAENSHQTRQVYEYHGSDLCYFRNISSTNSIIDYDYERASKIQQHFNAF